MTILNRLLSQITFPWMFKCRFYHTSNRVTHWFQIEILHITTQIDSDDKCKKNHFFKEWPMYLQRSQQFPKRMNLRQFNTIMSKIIVRMLHSSLVFFVCFVFNLAVEFIQISYQKLLGHAHIMTFVTCVTYLCTYFIINYLINTIFF